MCATPRAAARTRLDVLAHPVLTARGAIARVIARCAGPAASNRHRRRARGRAAGCAVTGTVARARAQRHEPPDGDFRHAHRHGRGHCGAGSARSCNARDSVAARSARCAMPRFAAASPRPLRYSALAGWSVPTQRTVAHDPVLALALGARRRTGVWDGLALAAAAACCSRTRLSVLAPGFWLSFGAVAAIVFATDRLHRATTACSRGYGRLQFAVTVGLVPVLLGSFGSVSLVSVAGEPARRSALHAADRARGAASRPALALLFRRSARRRCALVAWLIECDLAADRCAGLVVLGDAGALPGCRRCSGARWRARPWPRSRRCRRPGAPRPARCIVAVGGVASRRRCRTVRYASRCSTSGRVSRSSSRREGTCWSTTQVRRSAAGRMRHCSQSFRTCSSVAFANGRPARREPR